RNRRFALLFAGAIAIGAFDEGVIQSFVPHAVHAGFGVNLAAIALGLQSLAYVVGQVVGGGLSDRIGRRAVGVGAAALGDLACAAPPPGPRTVPPALH